jgi:hypothetical protein
MLQSLRRGRSLKELKSSCYADGIVFGGWLVAEGMAHAIADLIPCWGGVLDCTEELAVEVAIGVEDG